jgi:hypothetical protein
MYSCSNALLDVFYTELSVSLHLKAGDCLALLDLRRSLEEVEVAEGF